MDKGEEQDNPTLFEIMKDDPDITYNEATKVQEDLRLKKKGVCITGALKKDLSKGKEIDYHRYWKDMYEREHKLRQEAQGETTIVKGIGMNSPEMKALEQKNQELKKEMMKTPKFLRTVRTNKAPVVLDASYSMKAEPYNLIDPTIIKKFIH